MRFFISFIIAIILSPNVLWPDDKPNIILIFSDDHGYTDLGTQGIRKDLKTPHLDKLVAEGVRFTDGYVSAPQCVPSRAGLLTGKYQNRFGVEANKHPLDGFNKELTIAERLKKAGYVTGMTGKWHLGPAHEIVNHGFDFVYYKNSNRPGWSNFDLKGKDKKPGPESSKLYHLDANSEAACAFIKRNHDKPFFFYCAYRAPHVPLDAPPKYLDRFSEKMPKRRRQALAMISAMDDGVGKIMKTLEDLKLDERTLVFFIGDNGAPLKIHKIDALGGGPGWDGSLNEPLNGEKGMLTEGGVRVPFVAWWKKRIRAGQTFSQPVTSLDVAATAVELAGLPKDPHLDGFNIIPYLGENNLKMPPRKLFWRWVSQSAIRDGKWKFLKGGDREYLYDLSQDKEEKKNLIKTHPRIADTLKKELTSWSKELMPPGIESKNLSGAWTQYFDHYLDGKLQPRSATPKKGNSKGTKGWIVRNGKIDVADGVLRVNSSQRGNKNPFIVMNRLELPAQSKVVIKLKSARAGKVGVSWRQEGQKDFEPGSASSVRVKAGEDFAPATINLKAEKKIIHIRVLMPSQKVEIQSIEIHDSKGELLRKWNF